MLYTRKLAVLALLLLLGSIPSTLADAEDCPSRWARLGNYFVRPEQPYDRDNRRLLGLLRAPRRDLTLPHRIGVAIVQGIPRGITYLFYRRSFDFIPLARFTELVAHRPVEFISRRLLGRGYRAGPIPIFIGGTLATYYLIDLQMARIDEDHYIELVETGGAYQEIRSLLRNNRITRAEAAQYARNMEAALQTYFSRLENGNPAQTSPEEVQQFFRSREMQILFHHIPDLLNRNFSQISPYLTAETETLPQSPAETETALYQISNLLLVHYAIIPQLANDLLRNRNYFIQNGTLDASRLYNFTEHAEQLQLSPTMRTLLRTPQSREIVEALVQSPFTHALYSLTTELGEATPEQMQDYLMRLAFYQARFAEAELVGATWHGSDGSPLTIEDVYRSLIAEIRTYYRNRAH